MPRRTHPGRAQQKRRRAVARRSEERATSDALARRRRARRDDFDPERLLEGESVVRDDREARP